MYFENAVRNPVVMRRMLLYHFIPYTISEKNIQGMNHIDTLDPPNKLKVEKFYTKTRAHKVVGQKTRRTRKLITTVQCARIIPTKINSACNGRILFTNKVILYIPNIAKNNVHLLSYYCHLADLLCTH